MNVIAAAKQKAQDCADDPNPKLTKLEKAFWHVARSRNNLHH